MRKGRLYVLSGPSGAGKGTICKAVMDQGDPELALSVSMTTRAPREGEVDGVSYFFVTQEEYDRTVAEGGFLEHAGIYGNCYGTPKAAALEKLNAGIDVILEIEMQGALNVMRAEENVTSIYLLPPTMQILKDRLINRGRESEEKALRRFAEAGQEIELATEYTYVVINDDLEKTVETIENIIHEGTYRNPDDLPGIIRRLKEEKTK